MENSAKICFNRRYIAVKEMNAMGRFVNPGNSAFKVALASEIYIDKTGLLDFTNSVLGTKQAYICNSRPRRFGKSITADMLTAYYSKGCDSRELFMNYNIAQTEYFEKYLNKYDVIHLDMQWILMDAGAPERISGYINKNVISELADLYKDIDLRDQKTLYGALSVINSMTNNKFVIIIDEWDVLIRDEAANSSVQEEYINFLRGMFKGSEPTKYIELAFLTGILPIKKLKTQSALNNFDEYTMLYAGRLSPYIGFTEDEVRDICDRYGRDFSQVERWYDGYMLGDCHVYNPRAVVNYMLQGDLKSYWSETGSYDVIVPLINLDFDGLKTAIIQMLSGGEIKVNTGSFMNDTVSFKNKDDVLTYLVHLGYLGFDQKKSCAFIPNEEIRQELTTAVESTRWKELITFENTIENAREILANLGQNIDVVAGIFDETMLKLRGCDGTEISREPFCVAVSIHHRLAEKKKITLDDLAGENFMLMQRGWSYYGDRLRDDMIRNHPEINIVDFDLYNVEAFNWCENENEVLLAFKSWESVHPLIKIIPVEWDYTMPFGILHSKTPSDKVKRLIKAIRQIK